MTQNPSFGGSWTEEKLEILRQYLDAYTTALKAQPFTLIYVDAFAGSGWYRSHENSVSLSYLDFDDLRKGSAAIALEIEDKQFDRLNFIEKEAEFVDSLRALGEQHTGRRIELIRGDANEELPKICSGFRSNDRAVVFLDPYATEVNWETIAAIAKTQKIDCWILFPLNAISRMMDKDKRPTEQLSRQLDRIFGSREDWEGLYREQIQQTLFGEVESVEREPQNQIAHAYKQKLRSIFAEVAPTRAVLTNSRNSPLFELMFAVGNARGANIAIRIADQILKNW